MRLFCFFIVAAVALSGCEMMESKKIDYKSASKLPTLEIPPDLIAPSSDNSYAIPDTKGGTATFSSYNKERKDVPAGTQTLLPEQDKARIDRAGSQRWLVVQATPQQVWPVLKDFWQEMGFVVNVESPQTGVMETDWAENRAKIPQDALRNLLGKVIDSMYSTAERDKFRTRVEKGSDGTEIYISHRSMEEVFVTEGKEQTKWQPLPPNPDLDAEMLRRLMLRFGVESAKAESLLAKQQTPERARLLKEAGAPVLEMDDGFDRAWRRVGLVLDSVNFAVEDRDRSRGVYFVRYIDPQVDNNSKSDEGILSKLAFWNGKKETTSAQLQILVKESGDKSLVSVSGTDGKPVDVGTQNRIVNLLYSELK